MIEPETITLSGSPALLFTLTLEGAPAPFHVIFTGHEATGKIFMLVYSDSVDSSDEDFLDSFAFLD